MPYDSNGRIFVDRTQDPPIGIDPADVAYVLGRRSRDYGHLCGDTDDPMDGGTVDSGGKINKWSKHKPVRAFSGPSYTDPKLDELTDADYKKANFGLAGSFESEVGSSSPNNVIDIVRSSNYLQYQKPRGIKNYNEAYRVLDFSGYNHKAPTPYSNSVYESGDLMMPYIYLEKDSAAEILFSELKGFTNIEDLSSWKVVLIYRRQGTTNASVLQNSNGLTLGQLDAGQQIAWRQHPTLPQGAYDFAFAAFNGDTQGEPFYVGLPTYGTFYSTAYRPVSLALPNDYYGIIVSRDSETRNVVAVKIPFLAEDVFNAFKIAIEVYERNGNTYTQISNLTNEDYMEFNDNDEHYAIAGNDDTPGEPDFQKLNASDPDKLYYLVRFIDMKDGTSSWFTPANTPSTPWYTGTFSRTKPTTYNKLII